MMGEVLNQTAQAAAYESADSARAAAEYIKAELTRVSQRSGAQRHQAHWPQRLLSHLRLDRSRKHG